MTATDDRGRLVDRTVVRALGWLPGTTVRVNVEHGVVIVSAESSGPGSVTARGHLRLPAVIQHRLGLRPGDRMLLAGRPAGARLMVYPPAPLDTLLAASGVAPSGGPA